MSADRQSPPKTSQDPAPASTPPYPHARTRDLPVILASASPRRRELLARVGIPLEIRATDIPEVGPADGIPGLEVSRINARRKAEAIAHQLQTEARSGQDSSPAHGRLILAADTEVVLDGQALGKPASPEEAFAMLRRLSGRTHTVITAFALFRSGGSDSHVAGDGSGYHSGDGAEEGSADGSGNGITREVTTEVCFKALSDDEIRGYIATQEPFDKAGGYGIQGIGAFLVREIRGSYTNVVGLPLVEVLEALAALGGPLPFERL